ncbi:MAG: dnaG [Candidatus Saccharibacteria bacterium]|nr:dnaG [Candidatus Saccharibacteria bacterium]
MDKAFLSDRLPYQNHKLTQAEVLEAFATDAKQIIPALISELTNHRKMLVTRIGDAVTLINAESEDEAFRYYWTLWLALNEGEELRALEAKLARHRRMLSVIAGKPTPTGRLTDGAIEAARDYPIQDLLDVTFRRSGNRLVGLCPFHAEKSPSFYVFLNQNKAHCFGCQKSVDSISAYMELNGCDFKAAVLALAGGVV